MIVFNELYICGAFFVQCDNLRFSYSVFSFPIQIVDANRYFSWPLLTHIRYIETSVCCPMSVIKCRLLLQGKISCLCYISLSHVFDYHI